MKQKGDEYTGRDAADCAVMRSCVRNPVFLSGVATQTDKVACMMLRQIGKYEEEDDEDANKQVEETGEEVGVLA